MTYELRELESNELEEIKGGGLLSALGGFAIGGLAGFVLGMGCGIYTWYSTGDPDKAGKAYGAVFFTGIALGTSIGACIPAP